MEITVVGSGTVVPRVGRRQSCIVVVAGEETLFLDLGNGAVRGMLHAGLDPFTVDRVFFTHFHPDHTVDVVPLLFAIKYGTENSARNRSHSTGPSPSKGSSVRLPAFGVSGCLATTRRRSRSCPTPASPPSTSRISA